MTDLVSILFKELKNIDFIEEALKIQLPKFLKINSGYILEKLIRDYIHSIDYIKNEFILDLSLDNYFISNTGGYQLKSSKLNNSIYEIDDILTKDKIELNLIEIKSGRISKKYFNSKKRKSNETKTDIPSIIKNTKRFGYKPKLIIIYNNQRKDKVLIKSIKEIEKNKNYECVFLPFENKYEEEIYKIVKSHNSKIDEENRLRELELTREFGLNLDPIY